MHTHPLTFQSLLPDPAAITPAADHAPADGRAAAPETLLRPDSPIGNFRLQSPDALQGVSTVGRRQMYRHIRQLALPDRCNARLINSFLHHWPQLEILSAFDVVGDARINLTGCASLRWLETDARTAAHLCNRHHLPILVLHPPAAILCGASSTPGALMLEHLANGSATLHLATPGAMRKAFAEAHSEMQQSDPARPGTPQRATSVALRLLPHELLPRPGPLDWSGLLARHVALNWADTAPGAKGPAVSDAALSQACRQALAQLEAASHLLAVNSTDESEPGQRRLARLMRWMHASAMSHNEQGRPTDAVIHQTADRLLAQWHSPPRARLALSDSMGTHRRPMALPPPELLAALLAPQPPGDGACLHLSLPEVRAPDHFAASAALLNVTELQIDQLSAGHLPDGAAIASVRTLDLRQLPRPVDVDIEQLEQDFARMPLLTRVDTSSGSVPRPEPSRDAHVGDAATQLRKMK